MLALSGVVSWVIAAGVRRYALDRALLDVPNHRSSHTVATPRGGGLAIAGVTVLGVAAAAAWGWIPTGLAVAIVGGGSLVATVGWIDDRRGLPAPVRAVVHLIAAGWALAWLHGLPALQVGTGLVSLGWLGSIAAVVGIVWMTNLYNFMDGIDGLASGEATIIGGFGGALLAAAGQPGLAFVAWLIAVASAGFLAWNWSPAKLFMGDVGSGFLGFVLAVLAVASENARAVPLLVWLTLSSAFVVDATTTLVRRALHGEQWYSAHRRHAYQRAVQGGMSHRRVTTIVLVLNTGLCVLAWLGWRWQQALLPTLGAGVLLTFLIYLMVERHRPMYPSSHSDTAARSR
ncbi:MAG: MraY family glycosyltransferase [Gemmatimonadaceae bacterium]